MSERPEPRALSDDVVSSLLARQRFGTLATINRSGHPHLTTMAYSWDPGSRVARFSTPADRVKVAHLRRDPKAALHVQGDDLWSFAVAEGEAEISDVTTVPGDAVGQELVGIIPGDARPDDMATLFGHLVEERRVVIRLHVTRLYGTALDVG